MTEIRSPSQQHSSDVCDMVLKLNEDTNRLLTQLEQNQLSDVPAQDARNKVRSNLRQVDLAALSLDRGTGHIAVSISHP